MQTVTYIPYFLSWVILGGIFLMIFSQSGPANQISQLFGVSPIEFLTNDFWFIVVVIATGIWQAAGYGAVIYLAALAGISPDLYEAAVVDGAGRWKQTLHITIPGLVPTIITLFILNLGHVLNAGFDQIYNMYNPMVYDAADIIDTYVLRRIVLMDFGLATGAGLFKSVDGGGALESLVRRHALHRVGRESGLADLFTADRHREQHRADRAGAS